MDIVKQAALDRRMSYLRDYGKTQEVNWIAAWAIALVAVALLSFNGLS